MPAPLLLPDEGDALIGEKILKITTRTFRKKNSLTGVVAHEPRVVSKLPDGHPDGGTSNTALRLDQRVGRLVEDVAEEWMSFSYGTDSEADNLVPEAGSGDPGPPGWGIKCPACRQVTRWRFARSFLAGPRPARDETWKSSAQT